MAEVELEIGDVVQFKSGGPNMTVVSINSNDTKCRWYAEIHGQFFIDDFKTNTLKKAKTQVQ